MVNSGHDAATSWSLGCALLRMRLLPWRLARSRPVRLPLNILVKNEKTAAPARRAISLIDQPPRTRDKVSTGRRTTALAKVLTGHRMTARDRVSTGVRTTVRARVSSGLRLAASRTTTSHGGIAPATLGPGPGRPHPIRASGGPIRPLAALAR